MGTYAVRGERVLVFDPKVGDLRHARVHLHNDTPPVLAPGSVSTSNDSRLAAARLRRPANRRTTRALPQPFDPLPY